MNTPSNNKITTRIVDNFDVDTRIVDNFDVDTRIVDNFDVDTRIVDNFDVNTRIVDGGGDDDNNSYNYQEKVNLTNNMDLSLSSYVLNSKYKIYIHKHLNSGSYNNIYSFSNNSSTPADSNLIIRISNDNSTVESINSELKGIKIQYTLSSKSSLIGTVIDYGKLTNYSKNKYYKIQEYSIISKYGISLFDLLDNRVKYTNLGVVIKFMKNLLLGINVIHNNHYAHLDLKPENILLKNIYSKSDLRKIKNISEIDFVIVDFGGAKIIRSDKSKEIDGQMASAAFSPPELLEVKFGKKSDIWAYGVICYLVCIKKGFMKAKGSNIFMNTDKKKIEKSIHKAISKISKKIISGSCSANYIYPFDNNNLDLLKDFFYTVFKVDPDERPNSSELLKHPLFKLVV